MFFSRCCCTGEKEENEEILETIQSPTQPAQKFIASCFKGVNEPEKSPTPSVRALMAAGRPRYYSSSASDITLPSQKPPSIHQSIVMRRELLGFGLANEGQLGIRPNIDHGCVRMPEHIVGVPQCANEGASVKQVACGEKHTIILAEDGKMWSVGHNGFGQIGRGRVGEGSLTIYPVEYSIGSPIIEVACGREHSVCVTDDGRVFSWGNNISGQLGLNDKGTVEKPKRVEFNTQICQVACGPDHTIFLAQNGNVYVCGLQYDGATIHKPTQITDLIGVPIVRIAAGGRHWVALSSSGSVFTWGQNDCGQLGTGDQTRRGTPGLLLNISSMGVVDVSCGDAHTVLLTKDGQLFTFGSNSFGQLGCGQRLSLQTMSSVPCVVDDLMGSKVTRVAAGRCHTIAVVKGRVYTFGLNSSGQLGNGTSQKQLTPSSLENCDQVTAIFTGWDHTFIVRTAGLLDLHPGHSAILRYPMLLSKARIADYLSRREKMDLIGDLEVAFSSLSLLNGSFLYEDERRYKIDEKNHGVNLDDVMDAMNLLGQSSDSKQFSELIVDGCKESFFGKDFYPKTFISDECLRGFLILPWLNSFVSNLNKDVIERLHIPLSKAFKQLQPAQQDTLEKWWKLVPVRHFNRIVSGLVAAVSKSLERNPDITRNLPLLEVLTRLNKLNSSINKIPFESFYVDILSEKVDLKMDYCRWTAYNQQGRSGEHFWSDFPFILNGPAKGDLLHVDASLRQQVMVSNSYVNLFGHQVLVQNPMFHYRVRRKHIVEDTVTILPQVPLETLQKPLRVEFAGEEGEDGGGIRKEYFMLLFQQILQPEYGMFNEDSESHLVWFSGNTSESHEFKMVGTLTALAVYNNVLVDFPFPLALYKLLLKQKVGLDDFCELHPTEGKGLQSLLDYEEDNMEDVFDLMFSITHLVYGHPTEIELKPGGKDIPVNQQNKQEYVELYVKSRLEGGVNGEIGKQFEYFRQGFTAVMKSRLVNLFQPRELMELVSGSENYDWTEFREIVQYDGVYHASHPAILAFWEAFQELNQEERKKFLQFLSGTTRLPVKGMKELKVKFQPSSPTALPVAHTCANILDLPNINNKTEMLRRLRISLEHTSGFTLV